MSTFFIWQKEEKKTLLFGAQTEKLWGFAELSYDMRSLARGVERLLCVSLRLHRGRRGGK